MLSSFRELTSAEIDFVYGGDGETIVVTYIPPAGYLGGGSSGGGWGGGFDTDAWDRNAPPPEGPPPGCSSAENAAADIAGGIIATSNVMGPTAFDWRNAEYASSIVQGADGLFRTGTTGIYSEGNVGSITNRSTEILPGESYHGYIHNHPDEAGDNAFDLINRYPSAGDWRILASEAAKFGAVNPSVWIIDARGAVREFKLSDRATIESMSLSQIEDGVGLPSIITATGC